MIKKDSLKITIFILFLVMLLFSFISSEKHLLYVRWGWSMLFLLSLYLYRLEPKKSKRYNSYDLEVRARRYSQKIF